MKRFARFFLIFFLIAVPLILTALIKTKTAARTKINNLGNEYVFNTATTDTVAVAKLTSSKFAIAYRDRGNSDKGTVRIAQVSGKTISYGNEYIFNNGSTVSIDIAALSSNKIIIVYSDIDESAIGTAIIGSVSGTSISFGSEAVFDDAPVYRISIDKLTSSQAIIAYSDISQTYQGRNIIATISGSSIYYGIEYTFNNASTDFVSVSAFTSTYFVVAYEDEGNFNYGTARIGQVVGGAINYGAEAIFNTATTYSIHTASILTSKFVVAYEDVGNSYRGTGRIGQYAGLSISYGAENDFNGNQSYVRDVIKTSDHNFMAVYNDVGSDDKAYIITGASPALTITYDTAYLYNASDTDSSSAVALSSTDFVIAYKDNNAQNYGRAIFGEFPIFSHPNGTIIQVKSPYSPQGSQVYALDAGQKRKVPNTVVLQSQFSWSDVVPISLAEQSNYASAPIYPYHDCELVRESGDSAVYLFENGFKRKISSAAVFNQYNFDWGNIITAPAGSLSGYSTGLSLSTYNPAAYPFGCILKSVSGSAVYVRQGIGGKDRVPNMSVFDSQYSWPKIINVQPSVLSSYATNPAVHPYRSGELVKEEGSSAIYVFEAAAKRRIPDVETFNRYNYSWSNVVNTPNGSLANYVTASPLE